MLVLKNIKNTVLLDNTALNMDITPIYVKISTFLTNSLDISFFSDTIASGIRW